MVPTAVNIAPVSPEVLEKVGPYIPLAEDLGSMVAQVARGGIDSLDVEFVGSLADVDTRIVRTAVLKGLLDGRRRRVGQLRERRLLRRAARHRRHRDQPPRDARLRVADHGCAHTRPSGPIEIGATLVGKKDEPRLVSLYEYDIDMIPTKYMAFFVYEDRPGMIGKVGTLLGLSSINIGSMQVGSYRGRRSGAHGHQRRHARLARAARQDRGRGRHQRRVERGAVERRVRSARDGQRLDTRRIDLDIRPPESTRVDPVAATARCLDLRARALGCRRPRVCIDSVETPCATRPPCRVPAPAVANLSRGLLPLAPQLQRAIKQEDADERRYTDSRGSCSISPRRRRHLASGHFSQIRSSASWCTRR